MEETRNVLNLEQAFVALSFQKAMCGVNHWEDLLNCLGDGTKNDERILCYLVTPDVVKWAKGIRQSMRGTEDRFSGAVLLSLMAESIVRNNEELKAIGSYTLGDIKRYVVKKYNGVYADKVPNPLEEEYNTRILESAKTETDVILEEIKGMLDKGNFSTNVFALSLEEFKAMYRCYQKLEVEYKGRKQGKGDIVIFKVDKDGNISILGAGKPGDMKFLVKGMSVDYKFMQ